LVGGVVFREVGVGFGVGRREEGFLLEGELFNGFLPFEYQCVVAVPTLRKAKQVAVLPTHRCSILLQSTHSPEKPSVD
jgi:hypothetical protein